MQNESVPEETPGVRELTRLGVHVRRAERPRTEPEAQRMVAAASRDRWTVMPCGGGTSLGTGILPEAVDLVLDMTDLSRVIALDGKNLNVAVYAGCTLQALNERLAGRDGGFFLPLDPPLPGRATLGGIYAANGSGPIRLLYGTIRDLALGVRGINARGEEIGFGGKTVKNVSGLDVTRFLVGSAGSLGVVTSISFRILPVPEAGSLCRVWFDGLQRADAFLSNLRGSVLLPSGVVLFGPGSGAGQGDLGTYRVLVGFEGHPKAVERQARDLLNLARQAGGDGEEQPGREEMLGCLRASIEPEDSEASPVAFKVCVPIARGPRAYAALCDKAAELATGVKAALLAGSGIVYVYAEPIGHEEIPRLLAGARDIAEGEGGHTSPLRVPREIQSGWGTRTDPDVHRLVLRPLKDHLDPDGVFPQIV